MSVHPRQESQRRKTSMLHYCSSRSAALKILWIGARTSGRNAPLQKVQPLDGPEDVSGGPLFHRSGKRKRMFN
eukprot:4781190-Prymnesium_polylepis.1